MTAPLSNELLKKLAESMVPIEKDEAAVLRGNERRPLFCVTSPARGRATARAIDVIGDCADSWGLSSRHPQAMKVLEGSVKDYLVGVPVEIYHPAATDQYKINWYNGYTQAYIDLLPVFQPRNLQVPTGFVNEIPVSAQDFPDGKVYLLIHIKEGQLRTATDQDKPAEEQVAAATE